MVGRATGLTLNYVVGWNEVKIYKEICLETLPLVVYNQQSQLTMGMIMWLSIENPSPALNHFMVGRRLDTRKALTFDIIKSIKNTY